MKEVLLSIHFRDHIYPSRSMNVNLAEYSYRARERRPDRDQGERCGRDRASRARVAARRLFTGKLWALWCLGLELHSPVNGKIRRHINVGSVWMKSFGRDLQLESAKARVWERK